jgi:peptide/nickel transport system permease protein
MRVLAFLARRVAATLGVLGVVAVLVFLLLRLVPGDPAAIIAGDSATTEQIDRIREDLGLNRPLAVQFGIWSANVLRADLGESFVFKTVSALIAQRLEPTIALALCTIVAHYLGPWPGNCCFPQYAINTPSAAPMRDSRRRSVSN